MKGNTLDSKAIRKYLNNYAEIPLRCNSWHQDNWKLLTNNRVYHQAVVIPAFNESESFVQRLQQLPSMQRTLFVIVLNGPANLSLDEAQRTLQPLRYMQATSTESAKSQLTRSSTSLFNFFQKQPFQDFLFIDLVNNPAENPSSRGVGYARKFGMDCCLRLYQQQQLVSPLVRNTDADVQWPADYLLPLEQDDSISALIYPFCHTVVQPGDPDQCEATALYDGWLRYYVAGLKWATSPWCFHTIGSTLVIHLHHYAIQRGFPRRQAGEDFYLLNKLAKSGRVVQLPGPELKLSNRISTRTPFGTGRAINSIKLNSLQVWKFYHPSIFDQLRYWYEQLPNLYPILHNQAPQQITLPEFPEAYAPIHSALLALKINPLLQHCVNQCNDQLGFQRHLMQGVDASYTRKLVHWLRDHFYPGVGLQTLCEKINNGRIPFLPPAQKRITTASELALYLRHNESN